MAKAKLEPAPGRYQKLTNWKEMDQHNCILSKNPRITLFTQVAKDSKGKPGPGTYNSHKSKDKMTRIIGVPKR